MTKVNILLVEDNELQAIRVIEMLDDLCYEVIGPFASGIKALEMIQKKIPDLILMDISLQGKLDGIETAQLILERYNLPVVYMSGFDEKKIIEKAKSTRPLGYLIKPFTKSQLYATLVTAHDKKKMDEELELYREHLEQLVDERTRDLLESKQKAEQSDKLKTAFLENLSHEIRTPMNSMIGFSNLIAEPEIDEDQKKLYSENILRSGNVLLAIIDDIIEVAKIQSNQIKISKYDVNLIVLLHELKDKFTHIAAKGVNPDLYVKLEIPNNQEVVIKTDPYRLKQILGILIDNAIKFTDVGGVEFGFFYEKNQVRFYVRDTGIGIPASMLTEIFDRFTKVENDRNKLFSGTGLGLHLAKKIAGLLGGEIRVDSVVGKGSTFFFDYPCDTYTNKDKPIKVQYKQWDSKTILVAEDEELNFLFIKEALANTKVNILWARNGSEALKFFQNQKIDLILMDIKMPELNGFQAVEKIRLTDENIPIIAQTAFYSSNEREKSIEMGCTDFLSKPITPERLLRTIEPYLNKTNE